MKEVSDAFDAMFHALQKTGDPYDYPNATWAVIEECKKVVQSRLESLEKDAARYRMARDHANTLLDTKEHCIFERDGWEIHGLLQGDALDGVIDTAMQSIKD